VGFFLLATGAPAAHRVGATGLSVRCLLSRGESEVFLYPRRRLGVGRFAKIGMSVAGLHRALSEVRFFEIVAAASSSFW